MDLKSESKVKNDMEKGSKFNTENKFLLREQWNKPLIKFLSKKTGSRLVYMGLPSPDAEDIKHWIEFIKVVIAFQCREYNKPSHFGQSRADIEKLEEFLRGLERETKLDSYTVFDGYMEEVVLKGQDNSPQTISFDINDFITLYNLDFCNDISSPLEFVDNNGEIQKAYKFDAVKKIIALQKSISKVSNKFLFLLTVHSNYKGKEIQNFLNDKPNKVVEEYIKKYSGLDGLERNSRIVRLFVAYLVHQVFPANDFTPKILPVIRYKGINDTPLLHFVIMGIHTKSDAGATLIYQRMEDILNQKFVDINEQVLQNSSVILDEEIDVNIDPVQYFAQSKTFEKLWSK